MHVSESDRMCAASVFQTASVVDAAARCAACWVAVNGRNAWASPAVSARGIRAAVAPSGAWYGPGHGDRTPIINSS